MPILNLNTCSLLEVPFALLAVKTSNRKASAFQSSTPTSQTLSVAKKGNRANCLSCIAYVGRCAHFLRGATEHQPWDWVPNEGIHNRRIKRDD